MPHALPCDWLQLHPSNECCCQVVWLCMITKICEWIGPPYSANLLERVYDSLKERWLLLYNTKNLKYKKIILENGQTKFSLNILETKHYLNTILRILHPCRDASHLCSNFWNPWKFAEKYSFLFFCKGQNIHKFPEIRKYSDNLHPWSSEYYSGQNSSWNSFG